MEPLIIIPSRMASTRLPNKPLADICGLPMVVRVMQRAMAANVGPVYVAAAEQEIIDVVESHGGRGVLTDPNLASGTDRVKAAADIIDPERKFEVVINIQGDLPTLDPKLVAPILEPFSKFGDTDISTMAAFIKDPAELETSSVVKIALSMNAGESMGRALYFSRSHLPFGQGQKYHHMGMYAYKRDSLDKFVSLPVNNLEKEENLEQLRALAHGQSIYVKVVDTEVPFGVDTPDDLEKARKVLAG